MADKDDHLTFYREFFENFAETVNPNDQLPVKLGSYKLINSEVVGGVIDWTTQYLTQKKCPPNLIAYLIQIVIDETRKACKKQPLSCGFIPTDNAYQPLKLMQTVMAKTNEVCLRYLDNSMLCSLPPPGPSPSIVSVSAAKNRRRRMEDRHAIIHDLNTMFNIQEATPSSYYAIFDGHAGHDAAAYSSAHLHQFLAENKHFVDNPQQALSEAFLRTDTLFENKCKVEGLTSGTTAVCALLRPKEECLYIAWVGDSQALLVNQGRVLQCVQPHKPSREDERERIEKLGGFVIFYGAWRVNGQLAVSRAIGDSDHKPYVTAEPDVRKIPLDGGEDFLILGCDGLWDHLSEDDAARAVYSMISQCPDQTDQISERLVQLSKERGSQDNISVIVVFLRDPSVIANWANCNSVTMDASLDNANNPFATNGSSTDSTIIGQKTNDGLLLNLSDGFGDQNGGTKSPQNDFFHHMNNADNMMFAKSNNAKRPASDFDDDEDDLGPETNVDTLDDAMSSSPSKFLDGLAAGSNLDMAFNPFMDKNDVEKATLEIDFDLQKQQSSEFEERSRSVREETPTPPVDAVHDAGGLDDHVVAESGGEDSEDEWNYIKGEEANKENISPSQPDLEVAEINEEAEDNMSQLNPNAAEFVPVSPTSSEPSPVCRALMNDPVIAQSPKRATDVNISLPNDESEFEREAKSRPSDVDLFSNGHDDKDEKPTQQEIAPIDEILNGRNIDDILEFQPGAVTPTKVPSSSTDEFHFGPNATPFTPSSNKTLDPLEAAALSTMAVYGDESSATLGGTSFDESNVSQVNSSTGTKKEDPMSMSFYQDDSNDPFDLNRVQVLPDNIEEFLKSDQNGEAASQTALEGSKLFDDTISDLPEHDPSVPLDNDQSIQTTDLDKVEENEKELASPVSQEEELVCGMPQTIKCPDLVQFESQLEQGSLTAQKIESPLASPLPLSPEPTETTSSPQPDLLLVDQRIPTPEEAIVQAVSPSPTGDANSSSTAALQSPTIEEVCNLPIEDFEPEQFQEQMPVLINDAKSSETSQLDFSQFSSPPPVQQFSSEPMLDLDSTIEQTKITTETAFERSVLESSDVAELQSAVAQSVSPVQSPELVSCPDQAMSLDHPLMKCVYPLPTQFTQENLVTEKIVPEFPEMETVVTPSDATESREDEVPLVPTIVETSKVVEAPKEDATPVVEVAAVLAVAATAVAATGVVAASENKTPITKKGATMKKPTPTPTQKAAAAKPTSISKAKPSQASPRAPLKAASTTTAAAKSPLAAKPAPKPRSALTVTAPKTTERKPLTNGTSTAKAAGPASARTALSAPKMTSRPTTAPAKTTTTTTRTANSTLTAARPKPTTSTLTSRTPSSTTTRTVTSSTTAGGTTTRTTTLTKTSTAAPAKPRPTTAPPAKPRTSLGAATKTFPKTASIEKQNKEKANKLTASTGASGRTVTGSTLTSTTNKTLGITKKPETKTLGSRTAITKTTSAAKSTTITKSAAATTRTATTATAAGKKPIEITRNVKTKTTKIEKPVANGISTVVSEQITVINNAVNDLVKDNSPVDNKLIVDTNAAD